MQDSENRRNIRAELLGLLMNPKIYTKPSTERIVDCLKGICQSSREDGAIRQRVEKNARGEVMAHYY